MKTYTFHVSIPGTGRVWRKIEMQADQTLEDLHFAIQRAYGWDADHLYSFFMSNQAWDEASEYRLPDGYTPWGNLAGLRRRKSLLRLAPKNKRPSCASCMATRT